MNISLNICLAVYDDGTKKMVTLFTYSHSDEYEAKRELADSLVSYTDSFMYEGRKVLSSDRDYFSAREDAVNDIADKITLYHPEKWIDISKLIS